ncbi:MAG: hypothetical protein QY303_04700 [Vicingaceae bacterium]|nr:MAG: hypothetical protein QY303_04700 [Vicingaceae bacterium]
MRLHSPRHTDTNFDGVQLATQHFRTFHRDTKNRKEEALGGNSVYVAIAGEVVNRRSVLLKNFVLNGQVSASNPLLHIHAKRYHQW